MSEDALLAEALENWRRWDKVILMLPTLFGYNIK